MADMNSHSKMLGRFCLLFSLVYVCYGQLTNYDVNELLKPTIDLCKNTVPNCYCTDSVIDCDGADFGDIQVISKYLKNTTKRISITNGNIRKLAEDSFHNDGVHVYDSVEFLILSGNPIETVHQDAFNAFPNLRALDLSDNSGQGDINSIQLATAVSTLNKLEDLKLRGLYRSAEDDQSMLFATLTIPTVKSLDLSRNFLIAHDDGLSTFLCTLYELTALNLSKNEFTILPFSGCLVNVQVIDLSMNMFQYLYADDMDILESLVNLQSLRLAGNPWSCTCYMDETLPWLQATSVPLDFNDIRCNTSYNATLIGQRIRNTNFTSMCEKPEIVICGPFGRKVAVAKTTFMGLLVAGILLLAVAIIAVVIVCRRRRLKRKPIDSTSSHMIPDYPKTPAYDRMV